MMSRHSNSRDEQQSVNVGPLRVFPGKLAVSRAFGDVRAKRAKYGGKQGVISAEPEIKVLKISKGMDYILLASKAFFVVLTCGKR
jgi:protein phosphatase PTC2/3